MSFGTIKREGGAVSIHSCFIYLGGGERRGKKGKGGKRGKRRKRERKKNIEKRKRVEDDILIMVNFAERRNLAKVITFLRRNCVEQLWVRPGSLAPQSGCKERPGAFIFNIFSYYI
jgi:hypothetical protein